MNQPARKIMATRGKNHRWKVPYLKNGRMIHCESGLERDYVRITDFDQNVVEIAYQPLFIPYRIKGKIRFYYPDFKVTFKDGRVLIVEIKPNSKVLKPEIQLKALVGRLYCKKKGWKYIIVTEKQLYENSCLLFNIGFLRALGHQPKVPSVVLQIVYDTLCNTGASTIYMLRENCRDIDDEFFYVAIYKLIYFQKVFADLFSSELTDETLISVNLNHFQFGGEVCASKR
ncbi:TnsA endonuclease N-terminal domain-containing protein [Paenibacillus tritici]|uniref:TnsA endonuclease N-terminal domain-containing protein n=1 Tax=Paenibacillus tritici TaxID=1873425 RepID=UPI001BA47EA4|nr:TnsA endonuclease N-terminal domain-containing protein [Paenibacillus tritici]QUL57045.1 TnsA endonuclease N-terminal domain-containing protein [Paenibacillus tritici]